MEKLIFACGIYSLAFAVFHVGFWTFFRWDTELPRLSIVNRGIMQILNNQIIVFFLICAYLCFFQSQALLNTPLGNTILAGISVFWFIRGIQQFIYLRVKHYLVHALSFIFFLGALLFALPLVI